jgi:DNA-binding transcriptional ArsR family regulator
MRKLAERLAEIHSVFSNARRLLIFWTLDGREMSVSEIAEHIDSSMQNTSQHLRLMKEREILTSRRDGQTIYYRIAGGNVGNYCQQIYRTSVGKYFDASVLQDLREYGQVATGTEVTPVATSN